MPRKSEYAKLRSKPPESYPMRFHEALLRLMSGASEALIGVHNWGNVEGQRLDFRLFLQSWSSDSLQGRWLSDNLVRTHKTQEMRGVVLWASSRPAFRAESLGLDKKPIDTFG